MLALLLTGCTGGATTGGTGTSATTGTTPATSSTTTVQATGSVTGVVRTRDGQPVEGVRMQLCDEIMCRTDDTASDGSYAFTDVGGKTYSFDAVPDAETGFATQLVPLALGLDEHREVDVVLYEMGPEVPLPPEPDWVDVTDDLSVQAAAGQLSTLFETFDTMAGVRVDPADFPPIDELAGTPLALWYLDPYDAHPPEGEELPWRSSDPLGLPPGTVLEAWAANYDTFEWLPAGELEVTADGLELVQGGLPVISTLVVIQPD